MQSELELVKKHTPLTELAEKVRRWTLLDTMLKRISEKTKEMRAEKQGLTEAICDIMQSNNLQHKKIAIQDGEIRMTEKNEYTPLSYGYLEDCLGEIIEDESQVEYVIQYLKDHRETKTSYDLKRTYTTPVSSSSSSS
jgi:Family of unknown function (DUF5760)